MILSLALPTLELSLWRAETRFDRALMEATFAADFFEFGRSGLEPPPTSRRRPGPRW